MALKTLLLTTVLAKFWLLFEMTCGENCPTDCITCTSATYCSTCVRGKYGASCENDCSTYCNCERSDDSQICQKSNGACLHGCVIGYWGESCTIVCAKGCLGDSCNQRTGNCLYGCKANFYGHRCSKENTSSTSTDKQNSNQSCTQNNRAMVALYVVTSISVLVAAASVTGIVLILNRRSVLVVLLFRRFCREQGNNNISSTHSQDVSEPELENPDYQNLNRTEDAGGTYHTANDDYETDNQFGQH